MLTLKMAALVIALGLDTLMMAISLGAVQTKGKWRIALTFAGAEALMPLIGLFIGKGASLVVGQAASWVGGIALILVALWLLFFEDDDDDEQKLRNLVGWTLLITALSISLDELTVGFSIGLIGVPVGLTVSLLALQAILFTYIGLTFGNKLKRLRGEWAEKAAGVVLGLLGLWILFERFL